jgi:hypothetical protein
MDHVTNMLVTDIVNFTSYADGSGAPSTVEVRQGRLAARFALDLLGGDVPTCHGLGSGLSSYMTHKAADAARRLYMLRVAELGEEWRARNRAMYSE